MLKSGFACTSVTSSNMSFPPYLSGSIRNNSIPSFTGYQLANNSSRCKSTILEPFSTVSAVIHLQARSNLQCLWKLYSPDTSELCSSNLRHFCFNPRSRTGSDLDDTWHHRSTCMVSIHAPARGATIGRLIMTADDIVFQSTLPHGERPRMSVIRCASDSCFNPRSRTGSDSTDAHLVIAGLHVSIHAPARGATRAMTVILTACTCFNPRSRTGSDIRYDR